MVLVEVVVEVRLASEPIYPNKSSLARLSYPYRPGQAWPGKVVRYSLVHTLSKSTEFD